MKLSKVKKICTGAETIIVKRAETGIDINTWIGVNSAMYPVRGMEMTAAMAIRIWEIEEKKQRKMEILEDTEGFEAGTLITREELESLPFMGDTFEEESGPDYPGLVKIATIDGMIVLLDKKTNKAVIFREEKLDPVEGSHLIYIPVQERSQLVAVYSDGILEAVIFTIPWNRNDYTKNTFRQIAEIYEAEGKR